MRRRVTRLVRRAEREGLSSEPARAFGWLRFALGEPLARDARRLGARLAERRELEGDRWAAGAYRPASVASTAAAR